MMIRPATYLFFGLLLLTVVRLQGQAKDFQSWYELEVDKELTNRLGISGEMELRMENNSRKFDRSLFTLAASYAYNDYLESAAGIRTLLVNDQETGLESRYRLHTDLTGKYDISGLALALRMRYQYGFEEPRYFTQWVANGFVNRIKLKAAYHIFGTRFELQAFAESWGMITGNDGSFFKRFRYSAGLSYRLNFSSELGLSYILEDEFNQRDPLQAHIVALAFAYSF